MNAGEDPIYEHCVHCLAHGCPQDEPYHLLPCPVAVCPGNPPVLQDAVIS